MRGKFVVAGVTATKSGTTLSATKFTKSTLAVREKPANTVAPSITTPPTPVTGGTFSANTGTWTGAGPISSYTYAWYTCTAPVTAASNTLPVACTAITSVPPATGATYVPPASAAGKRLLVEVKARNDAQTNAVSKFSTTTGILIQPTANTVAPTLTMVNPASTPVNSRPTVGNTITTTTGTWTGSATITYTYQWYRCDSERSSAPVSLPSDCLATAGTAATYTLLDVDAGEHMIVAVTANNGASMPKTAFSKSAGPTTRKATISSDPSLQPVISGDAKVGSTHNASSGTWTGAVPEATFTYEWLACSASISGPTNTAPTGCTTVQAPNVTTPSAYVPKPADAGRFLAVKVTPVNGAPNTARYSKTLSPAVGSAPANSRAPSYTSTTQPVASNGNVTAVAGTWTGSPSPTLTILWYLCTDSVVSSTTQPESCRELTTDDTPNPSARTLSIPSSWASKFLSVAETATNAFGTTTVWSSSLSAVNVPATLTQDPILTGTAIDGNQLGVTNVSADGYTEPIIEYRWYRCAAILNSPISNTTGTAPSGCTAISGASATSDTYVLTYADAGKFVSARVRVYNPANPGGQYRFSASSDVVTSPAKNVTRPTVSVGSPSTTGKPRVGGTVSSTGGTWTGYPAPSLRYEWFSCASNYTGAVTELPSDCTFISSMESATSTLSVTADYVNTHLLVKVTASISGVDSEPAFSSTVGIVTQAPSTIAAPTAGPSEATDGERRFIGQTLNATLGTFTDGTPISSVASGDVALTWLRCSSAVTGEPSARPSGCVALPADLLNPLSYTTVSSDAGFFITFEETHRNEAGSATSLAGSGSRAVAQAPSNTASPAVTGSAWVGKVLTASNGTWTGPPAPTVTREWMRCPSALGVATTNPPSGCETLTNAQGQPLTGANYTVTPGDEGQFILIKVAASTDKATVIKYSATTSVIKVRPTVVNYPFINELDDDSKNAGIVGFAHVVTTGNWTGSSPLSTPAFQWYLCTNRVEAATTVTPTGSGCTAIASATTSTYTPVAANAGKYLTVVETRTNGTEPVSAWAASTAGPLVTAIGDPNPVPIVSFAEGGVTKTPRLGPTSVISTTNGTWAATPAVSFRYQWYSCPTAKSASSSALPSGSGCTEVSGATSRTLTVGFDRPELIGRFMLVKVTAFHPLTPKNAKPIYSASTSTAMQSAPRVKTAATTSGVPYVGATLTAVNGEANALPAATPTYVWLRCTAAIDAPISGVAADRPPTCATIAGATAKTYVVGEADFGNRVAAQITWTNSLDPVGAVSITTTTASIVRGPVNRVAPVIQARAAGPVVGEQVRVQSAPSDWSGSPTLAYQWYSCESSVSAASDNVPSNCTLVDGAVDADYTVTATDERKFLVAAVIATNSDGESSKFSASSTETLSLPAPVVHPSIAGKSFAGTRLTAAPGTWAGYRPPTFTYAWFVCSSSTSGSLDDDATCASSPVATTQSYTPLSSQVGSTLRVRVSATNAAGTTTDWSPTTLTITEGPYIVTPATIAGTADVSSSSPLRATPGSWGGNPYPVISGQWMRCTSVVPVAKPGEIPSTCSIIEGATDLTYALRSDDAGKFVSYVETAVNEFGEDYETSTSTAQVTMPPTVTTDPRIAGAPEVGGTLTRVEGTWAGFPAPTNPATGASTWWRCSSSVLTPSNTVPAGCVQIVGATGVSYQPTSTDLGSYIVYREQKKNGATGTISANRFTASTVVVTSPPVRSTDVKVTSTDRMTSTTPARVAPVVTKSIAYTAGTWTGANASDVTHRWFRCTTDVLVPSDTVPAGCSPSDASDATAATYVVTAADVGFYLLSEETAANVAATRTRYSASTRVVQELPTVLVAPAVSGDRTINADPGSKLTVTRGEWAGTETVATTIEWYRCSAVVTDSSTTPTTCSAIAGQRGDSYKLTNADATFYVTARVVATNPATAIAMPASVNYLVPVSAAEITAKAPSRTAIGFVAPTVTLREDTSSKAGPTVGDSFVANVGTWAGAAPTPTYSYAWFSCTTYHAMAEDVAGTDCEYIEDDTDNQLLLTENLRNKYIRVRVTATNSAGTDFKFSASSDSTVTEGLHYTAEPTVSPTASQVFDGLNERTVTVDGGEWSPPGVTGGPGVSDPAGDVQTREWIRCTRKINSTVYTAPIGCSRIEASPGVAFTGSTYILKAVDAGYFISAVITQKSFTNLEHTTFERARVVTASTDMVLEAPSITTAQTLSGTVTVAERIASSAGTWRGAAIPTKSYSWYRCSVPILVATAEVPADCALISGQTASTYTLTPDDRELYVSSFVTASNESGTATSFSVSTAQVRVKPINTVAPSTSDRPIVGQSFTANLGTWDGFPSPTYRADWFTCSTIVASPATSVQSGVCSNAGTSTAGSTATTTSITVPAGTSQRYMLVQITATNSAGSAVRTSATSQQIWETPAISTASNATKPKTSGTANVGQRLNLSNGTWVGFPNPVPTYRWYVCDAAVTSAGSTLPGASGCVATSTTTAYYDITLAEGGKFLVAGVTQTNSAGAATHFSPSTVQIGYEPRATVSPTASPTAGADRNIVGEQLTATTGTWAGFTTPVDPVSTGSVKKFQWYSCTVAITTPSTALPSGSVCSAITGANSATYVSSVNDAGKHIAVFVTQQNFLNASGVSSYVASPAQVSAVGTKLSTSVFMRQAPVATGATTLAGVANVGSTITASATTWRGFPVPVAADTGIEWRLCDAPTSVITDCALLAGETAHTISVTAAHAGKVLATRAWATNSVGTTFTTGERTAVISEAPVSIAPPVLSSMNAGSPSEPQVGQVISTTEGTWRSTAGNSSQPPGARAYTTSWYSCPASTTPLGGCTARVTDASGTPTYTPTSLDAGRYILSVVKATNRVNDTAKGTSTVVSATAVSQSLSIGPVNFSPTNSGEIGLASSSTTSAVRVGDELTIVGESWTARPDLTDKRYAWYACTTAVATRPTVTAPSGCTAIPEATAPTFVVTSTQGDRHMIAKVTATNSVGSTAKWTLSLGPVTQAAQASTTPGVSGVPEIGSTLTIYRGAGWSGFPAPAVTYRWFSCADEQSVSPAAVPQNCVVIPGQVSTSMTLQSSMNVVGKHILVEEKGTNTTGTVTRFSSSLGPVTVPPPPATP